ncbi:ABC transporter ATP-binding protein [Acidisphaera sp. L21]|uniref:ABC transporter ATP-binding protein n=1 Tax=Acidisphaera sp. L21 TaxID=1641851 RepID=UPI00131B2B75|nr:ABC transporter ATP-binding protein [Acidisphaera sp. L21]
MAGEMLLDVQNLTVQFRGDAGWTSAVENVSFQVGERECLGLVGESGSGKSVTALSILGLHARRTARIPSGVIAYRGQDILRLPTRALRKLRGGEIAMVFQDPMSTLNPVLTIADQITETLILHQSLSAAAARQQAQRLLDMVRIPDAARRLDEYPHRLSGGMRQRVVIAMAIACRPKLLIADEPTTALDVTIQAQILELLRDLQDELGMSVLLISHDLGVIAEFAHRVMVMYAGRTVETAPVRALFERPVHPYTIGLLAAAPRLELDTDRLPTIAGSIPDPASIVPGCRYSPRCDVALESCRNLPPAMGSAEPGHLARCPPRLAALGFAA